MKSDKNSLDSADLLVGTGAPGDRAAKVSVWTALVVATIGWQAIAVFSAAGGQTAGPQASKQEEQDLLEEFIAC
jgi:hypothetical protein